MTLTPKPRYTNGLRTYALPTGVFASNGDREAKNRDFGGKIEKSEKARYGCNAKQKRWRAHKYLGFVDSRLRGNDIREKPF